MSVVLQPIPAHSARGRALTAACLALLFAVGCGESAQPAATVKSADASDGTLLFDTDTAADLTAAPKDGASSDAAAVDAPVADAAGLSDAATADVAAEVLANCPGGAGCPCLANAGCDSNLCLDTTDGKYCAQNCQSDCPAGFACTLMGGTDTVYACTPKYGWRCEPCTASAQCLTLGQGGALCVPYGNTGSFCGSSCASDADCGKGFACKSVTSIEGSPAQQCVATAADGSPGTCGCSVRAVKLGLSTACAQDFGNQAVCKGSRTCKEVGPGGPTPCDAPKPVTEVCNNLDDDCNGATDDANCDDANPCTVDACPPSGGACSHKVQDNVLCQDGDSCTVGDVCSAGKCASGVNVCECKTTADCPPSPPCEAKKLCDTAALPHKCVSDPKTAITCDASADTACSQNKCNPKSGACEQTPAGGLIGCDDGNACTAQDVCQAGKCMGQGVDCDDKNACTDDACVPASGCTHLANSAACDDGNVCTFGDKCAASKCVAGLPPSCTDNVKNGGETDKDCGGVGACGLAACPACGSNAACGQATDCQSGVCSSGKCQAPTCKDGVKNGDEIEVDCGGTVCEPCPTLLFLATGGMTTTASRTVNTAWKSATVAIPSVDGVSISGGSAAATALLRYTKVGDLLDNTVQSMRWTAASGWQAPVTVGSGVLTQSWPACALTGTEVRLVYHGMDYKHYLASWSGAWSSASLVDSPASFGPSAPALVALGGDLVLVYMDGNNANHLTARIKGGGAWGPLADGGGGADFKLAPTAEVTGTPGELMAIWVRPGGQIAAQLLVNGAWKPPADIATALTKARPSLVLDAAGKLQLAFLGMDDKLYVATRASGAWSAVSAAGSPQFAAKSSPALAAGLSGDLELAWVDAAGAAWHSTRTGATWSAPEQLATGALHVAMRRIP